MNILHPPNWPRPRGYSNGISAKGRIVVTGGIVGWDENENFVKQDIAGQAAQAFKNIVLILAEGGAKPENIVRMTWYITDKIGYINSQKLIGESYRKNFGKHFPAMAVVEVASLMEKEAKLEIEVMAIVEE
ncbi:MAG: 2-iminobutanoate/2-iminopropanoate deaminase [Alphaproteobacteria bacterium MarineAlpha3_Bin7]|nr:MAG: 2-iminobutanoate/2-iminopropanoate deaminase [Alphaproteobacteria bacterium MarineAlpha3_Bin7]|tara:strand:- start:1268 stop:1660 length:393 start_codon:yes stop_codon:yes gene_type:complete